MELVIILNRFLVVVLYFSYQDDFQQLNIGLIILYIIMIIYACSMLYDNPETIVTKMSIVLQAGTKWEWRKQVLRSPFSCSAS